MEVEAWFFVKRSSLFNVSGVECNFLLLYMQHVSEILILRDPTVIEVKLKVINPFWKMESDGLCIIFILNQRERNI